MSACCTPAADASAVTSAAPAPAASSCCTPAPAVVTLDLLALPDAPASPTAATLLDALDAASSRPVYLVSDATGEAVRAGYHVSEVLAITVRAVDCGGRVDAWDELVLQILDEMDPDARVMTGERFAGIVRTVHRALEFSLDVPVRIEWGRPGEAARHFDLVDVDASADALTLRLGLHAAQCKPRVEGLSLC